MRVLIYGMQSSGASTLAVTFAQQPQSLAFVDIYTMFAAPRLESDRNIVAKVVTTTAFPLELHRKRFQPDITILVLRHPVDTFNSLKNKLYANEDGLIEEKFAVLEDVFRRSDLYDELVHFEDFAFAPRFSFDLCNRIGWSLDIDALRASRTAADMAFVNEQAWPAIGTRLRYGLGNFQMNLNGSTRITLAKPSGASQVLAELCPDLLSHYDKVAAKRGAAWHTRPEALLSLDLNSLVRSIAGTGERFTESSRIGEYWLSCVNPNVFSSVDKNGLWLCPIMAARTTLRLSGLPARPFDRVCCAVSVDMLALGTVVEIAVLDDQGDVLGRAQRTLCYGQNGIMIVPFRTSCRSISVELSTHLSDPSKSGDLAGVAFRSFSLEQSFASEHADTVLSSHSA